MPLLDRLIPLDASSTKGDTWWGKAASYPEGDILVQVNTPAKTRPIVQNASFPRPVLLTLAVVFAAAVILYSAIWMYAVRWETDVRLGVTEASVMGSVGNTLAELKQAVELVSQGIVTTVVDRTLRLDEFQKGIDALARSEPVGRVVLVP